MDFVSFESRRKVKLIKPHDDAIITFILCPTAFSHFANATKSLKVSFAKAYCDFSKLKDKACCD